ncbi:MAG: DUF3159 domain-containing protein [Micrococcales bacterium]
MSIPEPFGSEPQDTKFAEAAAKRLGLRVDEDGRAVFDGKSLLASLGGWVGIIESAVPPTAFLVIYTIWQNTLAAVVVAGVLSAASIGKQLIQRKPVSQAIAGAVLTGISVWLALKSPDGAKDYYLPGFYTNAGYGSVLLISILVRWPALGLLIGFFKGWGVGWRKKRSLLTRFDLITGMWVGLFALRLGIELPLFFANNVEALGVAKLILGTPTYAVCIWFTWLASRSVILHKS